MTRWLFSTNAKDIGTLYLVFGLFAGMIGTAFSMIIRLELASPGVQFLQGDHQLFNVIITAHAFIMIFFMVKSFFKNIKVIILRHGRVIYMLPVLIGSPDMAFPRLNNVSFWLLPPSLILLLLSALVENGAGTNCPNLSFILPVLAGKQILPALNPTICWEMYNLSFLNFTQSAGNLFSHVISTFTGKPIFGYIGMVYAMFSIGILGFIVWSHHMFTVGLDKKLFFILYSKICYFTMVIAVPTGIKVFSWLSFSFSKSLRFTSPLIFVIGFLALFTTGGVTGVVLANASLDTAMHDRIKKDPYYVYKFWVGLMEVGHFHYVLSMGVVFGLFAGFYYWTPKIIGKKYNEFLAKVHFWLLFIGVNFVGRNFNYLKGDNKLMPRRIPDYPDAFSGWNAVSSFGSIVSVVSTILFGYIVYDLFINGEEVNENPWAVPSYFTSSKEFSSKTYTSNSIEWALKSPVPFHAFNMLPIQS
uniref:Cytochrome c oxidase subunit 1 n=1 Tax=Sanghuangporus vaninii TaxID=175686 RepID=A0A7H1DSK6_9AGAM|nr:Cox1 [Sanghuangporus vaninii]QNS39964.1 Cox1 [Sanghuangporus vaninii]